MLGLATATTVMVLGPCCGHELGEGKVVSLAMSASRGHCSWMSCCGLLRLCNLENR